MTSRTVAIAFLYGLLLLWLHYATMPKKPDGTPPEKSAAQPVGGNIKKIFDTKPIKQQRTGT